MSGATGRRKHSPAVYRRRRLVLLILLIVIAVAVWLVIAQPWRGSASENETTTPPAATQDAASELPVPDNSAGSTPAATPDASASVSAEPVPDASAVTTAEPCIARDVKVEALTDSATYGSGQNPQLSIRLTNIGSQDCGLNVGTTTQVFTITSGSDTWWRSTDCQSEPSDMVVLLAAGQTVTSATPLTWDRTRSSVDTCGPDASRQAAPGGGATYRLDVEIGGIRSLEPAQILLY
jgi:hypothetical protein